jgi:hypothetical protein
VGEAGARGLAVDRSQAREKIYGMPYEDWKARYQHESTPAQKDRFEKTHKH